LKYEAQQQPAVTVIGTKRTETGKKSKAKKQAEQC